MNGKLEQESRSPSPPYFPLKAGNFTYVTGMGTFRCKPKLKVRRVRPIGRVKGREGLFIETFLRTN